MALRVVSKEEPKILIHSQPAPTPLSQHKAIKSFRGEYAFLCNFYMVPIPYEGIAYPSTEHAFQAAKSLNIETRRKIARLASPMDAKNFGRSIRLREDWEKVKIDIMEKICFIKFNIHAELRDKLMATGDVYLEEGNSHNDTFWGTVNGEGRNALGFVLMRVRDRLRGKLEDNSGFIVKRMR